MVWNLCSRVSVRVLGLALALALFSGGSRQASASEAATSLYIPGLNTFNSGVVPEPGFYFNNDVFYYHGSVNTTQFNNKVLTKVGTTNYIDVPSLTYVTDYTLLGAQYAVRGRLPIEYAITGGNFGVKKFEDYAVGARDLELTPIILGWKIDEVFGWKIGELNVSSSLSFYVPTGEYNSTDRAVIGVHHYGIDPNIAATWYSPHGFEFSGSLGVTFNFENPSTHYTTGDELHFDWAVMKHLRRGWSLGAVGYAFDQFSPDWGRGHHLGGYQSQVFAAGPAIRYETMLGESPVDVSFRYYKEFASHDRYEGDSFWLSFAFRF